MSKVKQYEVAAQEAAMQLAKERREFIDMTAALAFAGLMHGRTLEDVAQNIRAYAEAATDGATVLWERRIAQTLDDASSRIEPPIFTEEVVEHLTEEGRAALAGASARAGIAGRVV